MSYNLVVRGETHEQLKQALADRLASLVESQPAHAVDLPVVREAASKVIDLVVIPPGYDLQLHLAGYIHWIAGNERAPVPSTVSLNLRVDLFQIA